MRVITLSGCRRYCEFASSVTVCCRISQLHTDTAFWIFPNLTVNFLATLGGIPKS